MSFRATSWAWTRNGVPAIAKMVLLCLADFADDAGECFPSQDKLAEKCGMTDRSVRTAITKLKEMHLITVRKRSGTSDVFYLALSSSGLDDAAVACPTVDGAAVGDTPEAPSALGAVTPEGASALQPVDPGRKFRSPRKEVPTTPEGGSYKPTTYPINEPVSKIPPKSPDPMAASPGSATVRQGKALREEAAAGIDGDGPQGQIALPGPRPSNAVAVQGDFDAFWAAYPRKVAKGAARAAYGKALRKAKADEIAAALSRWMHGRTFPSDPRFIPHPTTWLNQERWEDWRDSDGSTYLPLERATMAGEALKRRIAEDDGEHELFEDSVAERRLRLASREEPRRMAVAAPRPTVTVAHPVTEDDIARCAAVWNGMAERHGMSLVEPQDISQTARQTLPAILTRFGVAGWQKAVEAINSSEHLRQRLPLSFEWLAEEPDRFARFAR